MCVCEIVKVVPACGLRWAGLSDGGVNTPYRTTFTFLTKIVTETHVMRTNTHAHSPVITCLTHTCYLATGHRRTVCWSHGYLISFTYTPATRVKHTGTIQTRVLYDTFLVCLIPLLTFNVTFLHSKFSFLTQSIQLAAAVNQSDNTLHHAKLETLIKCKAVSYK